MATITKKVLFALSVLALWSSLALAQIPPGGGGSGSNPFTTPSNLTGLTATTTPVSTDILYIVVDPGGTPLDRKVTVGNLTKGFNSAGIIALWSGTCNSASVLGGDGVCTAVSSVATSLSGTGATVTTSQPVVNVTQTWNDPAVTFAGLKANFTSTASAAASRIIDLQVGGATKLAQRKDGLLYVDAGNGSAAIGRDSSTSTYIGWFGNNLVLTDSNGNLDFWHGFAAHTTVIGSGNFFMWSNAATNFTNSGADTSLFRKSAGVVGAGIAATATTNGTFQGKYNSSDGTAGATVTTCTGYKDGLCISGT